MKVLYLDDQLIYQELMSIVLVTRQHVDVEFVSSGKEAIEKLTKNKYDLIISDVNMYPMDGIEFAHRVVTTHTPIMLVTGMPVEEVEPKVVGTNVLAVLNKATVMDDFKDFFTLIKRIVPHGSKI